MKTSIENLFFLLPLLGGLALIPAGRVTAEEYSFTIVAGVGVGSLCGWQDGVGQTARFCGPYGLTLDINGNIDIADSGNNAIRKAAAGGAVTTMAGNPAAGPFLGSGSTDGTGTNALFQVPAGIGRDNAGNLYVGDSGNYTVRRISPGAVVTTFVGTSGQQGGADGTGPAARFWAPKGIAVDSLGNIYVADAGNIVPPRGGASGGHTIRKVTPARIVTTLAGSPGISGSQDGVGANAQFNQPCSLAVDGLGNVYVVDSGNYTIRKITPAGLVSTLAGMPGNPGKTDGIGSAARFNFGLGRGGIFCASSGTLYVADSGNSAIRQITPAGAVMTLAAVAVPGPFPGTTAPAYPDSIVLDSKGNLLLLDSGANILIQGTFSGSNQLFSIASTASPTNGGTTSGDGTFASGNVRTVTATASSGYSFVSWTENGNVVSTASSYTFTLNTNRTLVANFTANLAVTILPESATIVAPANTINLRAVVTNNASMPTFQWCKASGADQVVFSDPTSSNTTATFGFAGTYALSVTAVDGTHSAQATNTVTVGLDPNGVFINVAPFMAATDPASQPNKFLTYGFTPTNDEAAANSYYAAIDPFNQKTTLTDWKNANGIPTEAIPAFTNGLTVSATYFNSGDLGFGRRMIMGGTNAFPAFAVSNFTNVDNAISGSSNLLIATVAMEYSPGTNGATFTKFYVFNSNGVRVTSAALDGGGQKFVPGLCIVCHGGQNAQPRPGDPYPNSGNVHAHFLPFDLRSFDYSCDPKFNQSAQEPAFKSLNQGVLNIEQSFGSSDVNRRPAIIGLIQGWYGTNAGPTLPNLTQNVNFVPDGWKNPASSLSLSAQAYLYLNVVAPSCRSCHLTRQEGFEFDEVAEFDNLKSFNLGFSIPSDVFGTSDPNRLRGTGIAISDTNFIRMPQARRTFERFWNSVSPRPQAEILRDYLLGSLVPPPPSILHDNLGFRSNNFGFSVSGSAGSVVVIEGSTNLTMTNSWVGVATNTLGTEPVHFTDPNSSEFKSRFYRARLQ